MRERAEIYLSDAPVGAVITKRNEAISRVEKVNEEVDELKQKAKRVNEGGAKD